MSPISTFKLILFVAGLAAAATFYIGMFLLPDADSMHDGLQNAMVLAVISAVVFIGVVILGLFYPSISERSASRERSEEMDWRKIKPVETEKSD